jgi:hypothetical protein
MGFGIGTSVGIGRDGFDAGSGGSSRGNPGSKIFCALRIVRASHNCAKKSAIE